MKRTLLIIFLCSGCTTLPDRFEDCKSLYEDPEKIKHCETKVIQREDNRYKRKIEEAELDRLSLLCTQSGEVFNRDMKTCKPWDML